MMVLETPRQARPDDGASVAHQLGHDGPASGDPSEMDLPALVAEFRANTAAYFAGRQSDDRFGMELFRRAVAGRDEDAWRAVHDAYLPLVAGWIARHPGLARSGEDSAYLANRAFERFWWALRPGRLANFPTLPSLLKYLKMCAHCAVLDAARSARQLEYQALDQCEVPSGRRGNVEWTEALVHAEQLWQTVMRVTRGPTEVQLAWDTLILGMTPREVVAAHPEDWGSVGEVYEAKAAMLRRLRSSPELAELHPYRRRPAARAC
jgi:hypothetical protein